MFNTVMLFKNISFCFKTIKHDLFSFWIEIKIVTEFQNKTTPSEVLSLHMLSRYTGLLICFKSFKTINLTEKPIKPIF